MEHAGFFGSADIFGATVVDDDVGDVDVGGNIIQAYEQILNFCQKHLVEKPHMGNKGVRISLRDKIMREWVINFLIHREFANPTVARLIITPESIMSENWNKPRYNSSVNLDQLMPFPKNPTIASVFREMGWIEEVGAGVSTFKDYCPFFYAGNMPEIEDGDMFRCTLRLTNQGGQTGGQTDGQTNTLNRVFHLILANPKITRKEIAESLGISETAVQKHIKSLKDNNIIKRDGGDFGGYWEIIDASE